MTEQIRDILKLEVSRKINKNLPPIIRGFDLEERITAQLIRNKIETRTSIKAQR